MFILIFNISDIFDFGIHRLNYISKTHIRWAFTQINLLLTVFYNDDYFFIFGSTFRPEYLTLSVHPLNLSCLIIEVRSPTNFPVFFYNIFQITSGY